MGNKNFKLNHFEEAYTSLNWIVRIFKRKPRHNRSNNNNYYFRDGVMYTSKQTLAYNTKLDERVYSDLLKN